MNGTLHSCGSRLSWHRLRGASRSASSVGWVAASLLAGGLAGAAWAFGMTASASAAEEIETSPDLVAVAESLTNDVTEISHLAVHKVPQDQLGLGDIVSDTSTEQLVSDTGQMVSGTEQLVSDLGQEVDELVDEATQQSEPADSNTNAADTDIEPTSTDQVEPMGGSEPGPVLDSISDSVDPLMEIVSPLVEGVEETTEQVLETPGALRAPSGTSSSDAAHGGISLPVPTDVPYLNSTLDSVTSERRADEGHSPIGHMWQSVSSVLGATSPLNAVEGWGLTALAAEPWSAFTSLTAAVHSVPASSNMAVDAYSWWTVSDELTGISTSAHHTSVSDLPTHDSARGEGMSGSNAEYHDISHQTTTLALDAEKPAFVHAIAPPGSTGSGLTVNDLSNVPGGAPASSTGSAADNAPPVVCHAAPPSPTQVSCVDPVAGKLGQPMDGIAELSVVPD